MTNAPELGQRRKINWLNVNTVLSAAILIGAEVFGAAYAGGWAVAMLLGLGDVGVLSLRVVFFVAGLAVMISFIRQASRVEPFITRQ
jgi:2-methylisocitrate lyase-like PEP mutase family enzyme